MLKGKATMRMRLRKFQDIQIIAKLFTESQSRKYTVVDLLLHPQQSAVEDYGTNFPRAIMSSTGSVALLILSPGNDSRSLWNIHKLWLPVAFEGTDTSYTRPPNALLQKLLNLDE